MTRKQALAEAKRRWPHATGWFLSASTDPCEIALADSFTAKLRTVGSGETWELAFADADRRSTHHRATPGRG